MKIPTIEIERKDDTKICTCHGKPCAYNEEEVCWCNVWRGDITQPLLFVAG